MFTILVFVILTMHSMKGQARQSYMASHLGSTTGLAGSGIRLQNAVMGWTSRQMELGFWNL